MKLTKQGKSYQVEYNGTHYYRMSFSETSIGSWFQIENDRYVQVDEVDLIFKLEQQFTTLELEPTLKGTGCVEPYEEPRDFEDML